MPPKLSIGRYTYHVRGEGKLEGQVITFTVANSNMNRKNKILWLKELLRL